MADNGNTPSRINFASAGATRRRSFPTDELASGRAYPNHTDLERAHFCCIAALMSLTPRRIIGNPDRSDVLGRADYLETFLGAITAYTKAVVADIGTSFPLGFIEDETDALSRATDDVAGALKNAVDSLIDAEVAGRDDHLRSNATDCWAAW
jgi:hypothetical protein